MVVVLDNPPVLPVGDVPDRHHSRDVDVLVFGGGVHHPEDLDVGAHHSARGEARDRHMIVVEGNERGREPGRRGGAAVRPLLSPRQERCHGFPIEARGHEADWQVRASAAGHAHAAGALLRRRRERVARWRLRCLRLAIEAEVVVARLHRVAVARHLLLHAATLRRRGRRKEQHVRGRERSGVRMLAVIALPEVLERQLPVGLRRIGFSRRHLEARRPVLLADRPPVGHEGVEVRRILARQADEDEPLDRPHVARVQPQLRRIEPGGRPGGNDTSFPLRS